MELLKLIGNTPLVQVKGFDTGPCSLFLKLENRNPGGSIKDRIAVSMIEDAENRGILKPDGVVIEATAGNTGLGLSLVSLQRGYKVQLVVPDKMSREKISHLQALGAQVTLTRSDVEKGHPDYYQDKARALAEKIPGGWFVDQFNNPANSAAHEKTTGPEIWQQMNENLDAVVVGVGSGGTLGGLTRFFSRVAPQISMVIADPVGSIIAPYIHTGRIPDECGSWLVEGIGEDFIPKIADFSLVKAAYSVPDKESFLTARELLRTNGLAGGSSSGTLLAAALRFCRDQTKPLRVVTFLCDDGSRYLSKVYSNRWMREQGFLSKEQFGDLRDFIAQPYHEGMLVTVAPSERVQSAYARMKMYDVSQLPVMENERIVGVLDESDLLFAVSSRQEAFKREVREIMSTRLKILSPQDDFSKLQALLKKGLVAIIAEKQKFWGIITKMDVVDHLRKSY